MPDKLLVLDTKEARDRAVEFRAVRRRLLTAVTWAGEKVRHDTESPDALQVVAVYSATGAGGGLTTVDVETIAGTRLAVRLPDLIVEPLCDRSVRVRDIGAAAAGSPVTRVEIDGRTVDVATPPVDTQDAVTLPVPLSPPPGDSAMKGTADANRQVVESSEGNNVATIGCIG